MSEIKKTLQVEAEMNYMIWPYLELAKPDGLRLESSD